MACASSIEEKPKPSRFPVSGLSAQTVNAAGGFAMGHYSPRHRARIGRKCSPRRCRRRPMFPGPRPPLGTALPLQQHPPHAGCLIRHRPCSLASVSCVLMEISQPPRRNEFHPLTAGRSKLGTEPGTPRLPAGVSLLEWIEEAIGWRGLSPRGSTVCYGVTAPARATTNEDME